MSPFAPYRQRFEANRNRPLPAIAAPPLDARRRKLLASSLARFQLGETGEGRIAHTIDRVQLPGVDGDYRACLKLFVAEEGRHARLLGEMVRALGGSLLAHSWTHRLFKLARHLLGVRFKMLVLLSAEVIAVGFYGALARALPEGAMADALTEICADERGHFELHCEFLRAQHALWRWLWWPMGTAAAITVLFDHRATLRAFGLEPKLFELVGEATRRLRRQGGAPAFTQLMTRHSSASLK